MTKVHRRSPFILALTLLATVALLIPGVLRPSEADNDSVFAEKVAGTYLVTREPAEGPSRILTIHADGNLSSIPGTGRMAKLLGARAPVLVSPMTSLPSGSSIPLGLDSNSQRGAAYTGGG
jgi:hypothetical protein